MASAIEICNLALGLIGDGTHISSIAPPDGTIQSALCAQFYPISLAAILQRHTWSFTVRRETLVEVMDSAPVAGFPYVYEPPAGLNRIIKVLPKDAGSEHAGVPFSFETTGLGLPVIRTTVPDAAIVYTTAQPSEALFPPLFVVALTRLLASFLAGARIRGATGIRLSQGLLELYEKIDLPRAVHADTMSSAQEIDSGAFVPSSIAARA